MTRETIGKISSELLTKTPETLSPIDQMREQLNDYDKNIYECIERSKKEFNGDFYIVIITKKERLMENVVRNFFMSRQTCPTPDYDQTVYRYNRSDEHVEFLWVIPSQDACIYLKNNALLVRSEERTLLQFVLDFSDGSLFRLCKSLNGEKNIDSPLLENN